MVTCPSHCTLRTVTALRWGWGWMLVEVELELEGRAVLEVVEGRAVEGLLAARLGVQRVVAGVELRALLGVRQHLRDTQTHNRYV